MWIARDQFKHGGFGGVPGREALAQRELPSAPRRTKFESRCLKLVLSFSKAAETTSASARNFDLVCNSISKRPPAATEQQESCRAPLPALPHTMNEEGRASVLREKELQFLHVTDCI